MSYFKRRVAEDLWVIGHRQENGVWQIAVLNARSEPVLSRQERVKAITTALREESYLRAALWNELPPETQNEMRKGRA